MADEVIGVAEEGAGALPPLRALEDMIFVAFNSRVFAIDRYDGSQLWKFKVPKGGGFVALLLDGDRLVVSSNGYTHGLDPWRGTLLWTQEFPGEGMGIPSLASVRGGSSAVSPAASQAAADEAQRRAAASS